MLGWPKVLFGFFNNILQKNLNELFGQPSNVIAVNKFHQGRKQLHYMIDFYQPGPHYTLLFLWCSCSTNVTFCSRRSHQVTWKEENIGWKMGWSMEKTFNLENQVKIRWQDGAKFNICHGKDTGSEIRKAGLGRCLSHLPAMAKLLNC